jgi:Domain of unknown function (DUF222)/HNH endonuclease
MCSTRVATPAEVASAFDALDASVAAIRELTFNNLAPAFRVRALERLETARRHQAVISHDIIKGLAEEDPADVGGPVHKVIADWLRISPAAARRRLRNAEQLSPRVTMTGETLPPELPATAQAWRSGVLDEEHLRVIQAFVRDLPGGIPVDTVDRTERFLAQQAVKLRPDQLEKLAQRCAVRINPDGKFSDNDRARQRGFVWCGQRPDGMSVAKLIASPELRANIDAWLARFAAPGMCNPDDQTACVDGEPAEEFASKDRRSHAQRQHDALNALVRGRLGDPKLGVHNGLPVTVIVSTTLNELTSGAGQAVTGGGTLLPMRDVIRMARHAYHYLAVFDDHQSRPLYLGRSRRIATPDQRVVLYAKDRGCTFPGCDAPGYVSEVHHVDEWAAGGLTNIDNLTFACHPHHKLHEMGWQTRKLANGETEWIPPPHLQMTSGTNDFHYPERYLPDDPNDQVA